MQRGDVFQGDDVDNNCDALIDDNDPGASSFEFSKGATASDLSTPAQAATVVDTSIDPPRGTKEGKVV